MTDRPDENSGEGAELDPLTVAAARQQLADWWNAESVDEGRPIYSGDSFDEWHVTPYDEFLIFSSPGGYTNRLYLVGEGVVRPFSYSTETEEYAVAAARADRDGTEPPAPPAPAVTWENWNDQ